MMEPGKTESDKNNGDQLTEEATSASMTAPDKSENDKKKDNQFTKTMDKLMAEVDSLLSQLSETSVDKTEKTSVMTEVGTLSLNH